MSDDPYDPLVWWWRLWLPQKTACQLRETYKANEELKETQNDIVKEVPEARHATRNVRHLIKNWAERIGSSRVFIF